MDSSRKNKRLFIDEKVLSTLAMLKAGLFAPITKLMTQKEADEVDETKMYKGISFPFSCILAPNGKKNTITLENAQIGETIDLINKNKKVGEIVLDEIFKINTKQRLHNIYGTNDTSHPGVKNTSKRLGELAICGDYTVEYPLIKDGIQRIKAMREKLNASFVSSMMLSANPLNRSHERIIRQVISDTDLLVLFLRKPFTSDGLSYDIRYDALMKFIENFLPQNKVIVIPFENSYIYSGYNELLIDAIISKNFGCDQLVIGKNHGGLGLYYDNNKLNSIFDHANRLDIHIKTIDEYVYCNVCNTLVSTQTCPHGQHHHIHYQSEAILKLIQSGLIPPSILVRKEVSANILASLFPDRFDNLQSVYYSLLPSSGLLEEPSQEQFYLKLIELYQTSSLN